MRIQRQAPRFPVGVPLGPVATSPAAADSAAPVADVFNAAHDMRHRVGASALVAGRTHTATPRLLDDWKHALLEAEADDRAHAEVVAPVFDHACHQAEAARGAPLDQTERRQLHRQVVHHHRSALDSARVAHWSDIDRSASTRQQTERDVVLAQRPRVSKLRDVFTPIAERQPGARDNEIVLWENKSIMVVVDTFASSPKALVVPKAPLHLPLDATPQLLDELAVVAAHVSDAFSSAGGAPPSGIWINPPQHVAIRQLHVHVLPDLAPFTADRSPPRTLLADPAARALVDAFFDTVSTELARGLGPTG
jgi:diadenosine tetraphosphate (Ap4A) HIT family hydrolase